MQKSKIFLTIIILSLFTLYSIPFIMNSSILSKHQSILASPKTSTYTIISPIVITSDSDWATYASGGSGNRNNPWNIENLYIDCAGSGTGISISNTLDYAIIRDCFINNSGTGGSDCAILCNTVQNVEFQDVLINRTGNIGIAIATSANMQLESCSINDSANNAIIIANDNNVNVDLCYVNKTSVSQAITITDSNNIVINNSRIDGAIGNCVAEIECSEFIGPNANITVDNTILNAANGCEGFTVRDTTGVRAKNDTFNGGMGFDDNSGTCSDILVSNCTFNNSYSHGLRCIDNFVVDNCRFIYPYASVNPYVITIHGTTNYTVERCLFVGSWGIAIEGAGNTNAYILNNTFLSNATDPTGNENNGIETGSTNYMTIEYNYFVNCTPAITIGTMINDTIEHNWFYNQYTSEIEYLPAYDPGNYGFGLTVVKNNYFRDYFTRFPYSNEVNASGVLDHQYSIDNDMSHLTSRYDPEPLYWTPWFSRTDSITWAIYSSIDGLGIDMDWFKVLVNNFPVYNHVVQISNVLYSISVQDFANRTYYSKMYNVNVTRNIYVAIPITTLNVFNNGTVDAYFYFTRNNVTTVFVISPGQVYSLRVIVGTFSYTVKYSNGTVVISNSVLLSNISGNITGPTAITINLGFTKVTVPPTPSTGGFTWFDTLISITVFVIIAIVAIILYVIVYNRKSANRVKEQEHARHRFKI